MFTFWPPGPLERENVNEISLSGIDRFELISILITMKGYIMSVPEGKSIIR